MKIQNKKNCSGKTIIVFAGSQKKHRGKALIILCNLILQPDTNINGVPVTFHCVQTARYSIANKPGLKITI